MCCSSSATSSGHERRRDSRGAHGRILRRIYGERDLLVAECLRRGVWNELDAAGLAAMAAASSTSRAATRASRPTATCRRARSGRRSRRPPTCGASSTTSSTTTACPAATRCRPGCRCAMHRWAQGARLDCGAARRRPRRGRLRALDEADDRPARPDLGRRRRARSAPDRAQRARRHPPRHRRLLERRLTRGSRAEHRSATTT